MAWIMNQDDEWEQVPDGTVGSYDDTDFGSDGSLNTGATAATGGTGSDGSTGSSGATGSGGTNNYTKSLMDTISDYIKTNPGPSALGGGVLAAILADRNRKQTLKTDTTSNTAHSKDYITATNTALAQLGKDNFDPTYGLTNDQTNALSAMKSTAENKYGGALAAGLSNNQSSGITNARDTMGKWSSYTADAKTALDNAKANTTSSMGQYTGPLGANMTANQTAASNLAKSSQGNWQPNMTAAAGQINAGATTIPQADMSAYMNPYIMASLQPQLLEHDRNLQQQLNQADAKSLNSWGNRADLVRNDMMRGGDVTRSGIVGQGLNTGYNTATNLFQQDQERRLKAGGALADLATSTSNLTGKDITNLGTTGAVEQGTDRANSEAKYKDFTDYMDRLRGGATANTAQAGALSDLATNTSNLNLADTNSLMGTGAVATASYQNQLDKQYQEFLRQQNAAAGFNQTGLDLANTSAKQDFEADKFAAGLPAANAAAIAGLKLPGTTTTSQNVTGSAPNLAAQLGGAGMAMFGLNSVMNPTPVKKD